MKRFTQFVEAKEKTAVFTFGRFNPPTIGHQKLLQKVHKVAKQRGGVAHIFGSFTQDKKKNPLQQRQKMKYLKEMFPKEMKGYKPISGLKTAIDVALHLNDYEHMVMVVGSDRVKEFDSLLTKYNGVEARHGLYNFKSIEVISAGERDPDAEGVSGMSASKMRAAAVSGDFESFKLGCPKGYDCTQLFNDVRKGMGIEREIKPFKPVSEMNNNELVREEYFQNLIYGIGDWVKDTKTGIIGEVVKRGTNYVTIVQEDFSLHKIWLENVKSMEKQQPKLPEAINFIKNRNLWEKYNREKRMLPDEGTTAARKLAQKMTPGEKKEIQKENAQRLAIKFKIPMNVAELVWEKLINAGLNPLKIQSYASMLTTFMNIMDEKIPEVAPPGKEKVVKALKKKWPDNMKRVYATAWWQHNKEKGK